MGDQQADQHLEHCDQCHTIRVVVEESSEVVQEFNGQRGVKVTRLECGHEIVVPDGTFYPFP